MNGEKLDTSVGGGLGQYSIWLKALYTGSDLNKIDGSVTDNTENKSDVADTNKTTADIIGTGYKILTSDILKRFIKNPIGFVSTYFFEGLRYILGDSIQTLAQIISFSDTKIEYNFDELNGNQYEDIKKHTVIKSGINEKQKDGEKVIKISEDPDVSVDEEYRRFSAKTKIPYISIDLYNIAADNVEFYDTNFLTVDKTKHSKDSPWLYLRNFITGIIHISIYLGAAILLGILIVNGIQIIRHTFDNPEARADSMKGLRRFAISLLMLIGTVIIMALCIYGSNMFLDDIKMKDKDRLPIRVKVEEADYSFSTNITGYFRYRSEIEGIHQYKEKAMYTIIYIVLAWTNFALAVFMDLRMIGMMILGILGPIIAVLHCVNYKSTIKYRTWVKAYIFLTLTQLIFAIIYRIIMSCAF